MRVALLVGPCPPGECGVGDYVVILAESLNALNIPTEVISVQNWTALEGLRTHRSLEKSDFDVVQLHYPSLGIGAKLGPQCNALLRRCVITLHEASKVHVLRQLALYPFAVFPRHLVFFSEFERRFARRWAPWTSSISSVIPPPSNIRKVPYDGPRSLTEIVSFGLIRPGRGHDRILELATLIKRSMLPLTLRVIGSPQSAKFIPYFDDLRAKSTDLPIIWESSLTEVEVGKRLASASIAYLPYPDGAAELRSSLKAALLNGIAIVTTRGPHTPRNLEGVVCFSRNPQEALAAIGALVQNAEMRQAFSQRASEYVKDWTWERTAQSYTEIYRNSMSMTRSRHVITSDIA